MRYVLVLFVAACSAAIPDDDWEWSSWAEARYEESPRAAAVLAELDDLWAATAQGVTPVLDVESGELFVCAMCIGRPQCPEPLDYTNLSLMLMDKLAEAECPTIVSSDSSRRRHVVREHGQVVQDREETDDHVDSNRQSVMSGFLPRHIFAVYGGRPYNCMGQKAQQVLQRCWNPRP